MVSRLTSARYDGLNDVRRWFTCTGTGKHRRLFRHRAPVTLLVDIPTVPWSRRWLFWSSPESHMVQRKNESRTQGTYRTGRTTDDDVLTHSLSFTLWVDWIAGEDELIDPTDPSVCIQDTMLYTTMHLRRTRGEL